MGKSISAIAAEFLKCHMDSTGSELARVEHVDTRRRDFNLEVEAVQEYLAAVEADPDRLVRYDVEEPEEHTTITETDAEPREPEVIFQSLRAGEFIYDIEQTDRIIWCWHPQHARRFKLSEAEAVTQYLANRKIETLISWA